MSMLVTMHPIWQSAALILGITVAVALFAQVRVQRVLSHQLRREHTELGTAIFSVIGVTYAVLLSFVATTAWEQHTVAESLARREANAIDALYRASQGAPPGTGDAIRTALASYTEQVIEVEWPEQIAGHPILTSSPLVRALDRQVFATENSWDPSVRSFMISSLAELVSVRRDRLLSTHGLIPDLVWIVLLCGGALMVSFSFMLDAPNVILHMVMTAALVTSGVLVLLLVAGLSSPFQGEVTIPPDAYKDVLASIRGGR